MTEKYWDRFFRVVRCVSLFARLVWREYEPKSCGIPDEYRIHHRITIAEAYQIASTIWL